MDAEVEHALGDVGGVAVAGGRRELVVEGAVRHVEVDPLGEVVRVEYRLRGRVREPSSPRRAMYAYVFIRTSQLPVNP